MEDTEQSLLKTKAKKTPQRPPEVKKQYNDKYYGKAKEDLKYKRAKKAVEEFESKQPKEPEALPEPIPAKAPKIKSKPAPAPLPENETEEEEEPPAPTPPKAPKKLIKPKPAEDDDDDGLEIVIKRKKKHTKKVVIVNDEDDSEDEHIPAPTPLRKINHSVFKAQHNNINKIRANAPAPNYDSFFMD
jgi:hypothetical protein